MSAFQQMFSLHLLQLHSFMGKGFINPILFLLFSAVTMFFAIVIQGYFGFHLALKAFFCLLNLSSHGKLTLSSLNLPPSAVCSNSAAPKIPK